MTLLLAGDNAGVARLRAPIRIRPVRTPKTHHLLTENFIPRCPPTDMIIRKDSLVSAKLSKGVLPLQPECSSNFSAVELRVRYQAGMRQSLVPFSITPEH